MPQIPGAFLFVMIRTAVAGFRRSETGACERVRPAGFRPSKKSSPGGGKIRAGTSPLHARYAWGGCSRSSRRSPAMSVTGRENTRDWASVCIPA